nr:hypothetical protein [Tanacetum cinerariifolium]
DSGGAGVATQPGARRAPLRDYGAAHGHHRHCAGKARSARDAGPDAHQHRVGRRPDCGGCERGRAGYCSLCEAATGQKRAAGLDFHAASTR